MAIGCLVSGCQKPVPPPAPPVRATNPMDNTPFIMPGVRSPQFFAAAEVQLPDDLVVIGVQVGEQPRAYLQKAMSQLDSHVVNGECAGVPVSVTYCDRTDCVRVFTRQGGASLIDLQTGGFSDDEMLVRLDGVMYPQSSPDLPLQELKHVQTTWGQWLLQHPATTIYLGEFEKNYRLAPTITKPTGPPPAGPPSATPATSD